jgi:hypothetical protein
MVYRRRELFGVENQIYWNECDAVAWLSDQRLGEAGWRLFDIDYGRGRPYDLQEGLALNASSFYVVEDRWATDGAQEFPFGTVVPSEAKLSESEESASVMYVGGSAGDKLSLIRTQG